MCRSAHLGTNSVPLHKEVLLKSRIVNTHGARDRDGEGPIGAFKKCLFIYCMCRRGRVLNLFFHDSPPGPLRQNLRLLCPAWVKLRHPQRSSCLALLKAGITGICRKHLQLLVKLIGSELQASFCPKVPLDCPAIIL